MVNKPLIRPYFLGGVALGGAARIPLTKGLRDGFLRTCWISMCLCTIGSSRFIMVDIIGFCTSSQLKKNYFAINLS